MTKREDLICLGKFELLGNKIMLVRVFCGLSFPLIHGGIAEYCAEFIRV